VAQLHNARRIAPFLPLPGLILAIAAVGCSQPVRGAWAEEPQDSAAAAAAPSAAPSPASAAPKPTSAAPAAETPRKDGSPRHLWMRNPRDVRAASFQGLTPGSSSTADVKQRFGEPKEAIDMGGDEQIWLYQVGPFPRVEVHVNGLQVPRIQVQFAAPRPAGEIIDELQLTRFAATPQYDDHAAIQGLLFPERGLRLVLKTRENQPQVTDIVLRAPDPADFVARAERDQSLRFSEQLADVEQALQLNERYVPALLHQAHVWTEIGFPAAALERLEQAAEIAASPQIAARRAGCLLRLQRRDAAGQAAAELLARPDLPALARCQAELVRAVWQSAAQWNAGGESPRDHVNAYMRVIADTTPLTLEGAFDQRRAAREIIMQAHLGAARVIARGDFRNKGQTLDKWLANAEALADRHVRLDHAPPAGQLPVWTAALECHAQVADGNDPAPTLLRMEQNAAHWLAAHDDELYQRYVRKWLGRGLLAASKAYQLRGETERAAAIARRAVEVLGEVARQQPTNPELEFWLGRSYFAVGTAPAIVARDHKAAVTWFTQAEPLLTAEVPPQLAALSGDVGDELVSMGISFWDVGEQQRGLQLTQRGLQRLEAAAAAGDRPPTAPALACSNLAFMHAALGNQEQSRHYAELAQRLRAAP
jgi:hypothetical protein